MSTTKEQDFFNTVKGKRIEMKSGPFNSRFGAFIPDRFEGNRMHGQYDTGIPDSWMMFWETQKETSFETSNWKFAPPKKGF